MKKRGAPFDLELTRGTERCTVEVKGTTSMGEGGPSTLGEVRHGPRVFAAAQLRRDVLATWLRLWSPCCVRRRCPLPAGLGDLAPPSR